MRAEAGGGDFYEDLNVAIHEMIASHVETPLLYGAALGRLNWHEQVRRTYHISTSRLQAMLDMADFVYPDPSGRLDPAATPLGAALVEDGAIGSEGLRLAKAAQLCRRGPPGPDIAGLAFLPQAGQGLDYAGIAALMKSVDAWL